MGALASRQNATVEEADMSANHQYKYPPRSGNYFGTHFIMGGERFDTPQPEAYLFGENADLNFLGCKPTPFPYPPPQATEPTKTLKSLINIRKESVRFVKASDCAAKIHGDGTKTCAYNIEFVFDADARCAITIYYFCIEDIGSAGVSYIPRDSSLSSETFHFKRGVNQLFSAPSHVFNPSLFSEDELAFSSEKDTFPVVIHCAVEEGNEESRQSHTTICVVDHHSDGTYALRALKQKIFVDGLCYLLQEIYGIENKLVSKPIGDEDTDDNGSECVICMCDTRDTLILPCRHLCLCNSCADSLRYQANNCPICRAPFRALLQIRAVQKNTTGSNVVSVQSPQDSTDNIPSGYIPVSLIEALNGPTGPVKSQSIVENVTATENANETTQNNQTTDKQDPLKNPPKDASTMGSREKLNQNVVDFRMSVLLSKEDGSVSCVTKELLTKHSPLMQRAPVSRDKNPREKGSLRIQSNQSVAIKEPPPLNHEVVQLVNEKIQMPNLTDLDDDSEAEKLSPLLQKADHDGVELSCETYEKLPSILRMAQEEAENLDARSQKSVVVLAAAEDSDYYTPEDPHTTILSPLKGEEKLEGVKKLSTPLTVLKEASQNSLPDSPISGNSHTSTRSSGDSYSSSSSTRQLLSSVTANDTPTHVTVNVDSSVEGLVKHEIKIGNSTKIDCIDSD
ncbi:E3 ubiquitin-protein ligase MGRN1 [Toxorhynchites rutilus septentrionalis]|uniref:E3 ubiquitin-protein ligase MGRN1 n=1 Tax=Toxorhynchites rutilus septentrionalis TaxID=329112 RepID=UPI00247A1132|nr:E3 ubiquitin-protein ligase MGRN1 [Toxorhynchites rutilus septentrionalis]